MFGVKNQFGTKLSLFYRIFGLTPVLGFWGQKVVCWPKKLSFEGPARNPTKTYGSGSFLVGPEAKKPDFGWKVANSSKPSFSLEKLFSEEKCKIRKIMENLPKRYIFLL